MDITTLSMLATRFSFFEIIGMLLLHRLGSWAMDQVNTIRWSRKYVRRIAYSTESAQGMQENALRTVLLYRAIMYRVSCEKIPARHSDTVLMMDHEVSSNSNSRRVEKNAVQREIKKMSIVTVPSTHFYFTVGNLNLRLGHYAVTDGTCVTKTTFVEIEGNSNEEIDSFVAACWETYKTEVIDRKHERQAFLLRNIHYNAWSAVPVMDTSFDDVFFPRKDRYIELMKAYQNSQSLCVVLLTGVPGVGKTSIIQATATLLRRHIVPVPLNNLADDDFLFFINNTDFQDHAPSMSSVCYVIEDIDALTRTVFQRDKEGTSIDTLVQHANNGPAKKLTLSGVLNALDGIVHARGQLIFITTNYPEKLDSALVRPGRIDVRVDLPSTFPQSTKLEIWKKTFPNDESVPDHLWNDDDLTPAAFMNAVRHAKMTLRVIGKDLSKTID